MINSGNDPTCNKAFSEAQIKNHELIFKDSANSAGLWSQSSRQTMILDFSFSDVFAFPSDEASILPQFCIMDSL